MALSKAAALGITAVCLAVAGAAAWYLGITPGPAPGPTASTPVAPANPPTPPHPTPVEGKTLPRAPKGTGCVTGRLVRGTATNPVQGEVTVAFAGSAPTSVRAAGRGYFRIDGLPVETPFTLKAEASGLIPALFPDLRIPITGILDLGDLELGLAITLE